MDSALAIFGFGRIGRLHARWAAEAGWRIAKVVDPTEACRRLAERAGLSTTDCPQEVWSDPAITAVLIATPTAMHFEQGLAALEQGRHVMIEKPMAMDSLQSLRLIQQAESRRRVLSVFHNRRWDADFLTLLQAVRRGHFGRVFNIESRLGQWASCVGPAAVEYRPNWRNEKSFGGGGLYDWGSHFIDQIWRLVLPARPVRVFAQLAGNLWGGQCDDLARVCLDFDDGCRGLVEINCTTTRPLPRWHVDGELGSASSPASATFDIATWANFTFTPADGSPPRTFPAAAGGLCEVELWTQFLQATRGVGEPAVAARSVLPTMRLLDAARASAAAANAVAIDPGD